MPACAEGQGRTRTPLLLSVHFRYRPLRKKEVERKKNGNGSRFGRMNTEDRRTSERHGKQENIMVLLPLPSPPPLALSLCLLMESFRTARSVCRLSSLPKSNFKRSKCNYTEQNGLPPHQSRPRFRRECPRPFGCFTNNLGRLFYHFRTFGGDEME